MKKFFAVLCLSLLLVVPTFSKKQDPVVPQPVVSYQVERAAVGAISIPNPSQDNGDGLYAEICSGSMIGTTNNGADGLFLTARHCVWDDDEENDGANPHFIPGEVVSFGDNLAGPYYQTDLYAISVDDDLAVLRVINAGGLPTEVFEDEHSLNPGDPVENISFPLDMGKLEFHGQFVAPVFPHFSRSFRGYPQWANTMPVDITIGHGSSGSPLFDSKTHCVIGVMVGTTGEGRLMVVEPASRFLSMVSDLNKNSVSNWIKSRLPKGDMVRLPRKDREREAHPYIPGLS